MFHQGKAFLHLVGTESALTATVKILRCSAYPIVVAGIEHFGDGQPEADLQVCLDP